LTESRWSVDLKDRARLESQRTKKGPNLQTSKAAPSLAFFNDRLWVAFTSDKCLNRVLVCSTADGQNWSDSSRIPGQASQTGPSLAVFQNRLWVAFVANNSSNQLLICSLRMARNGPATQASQTAPSLAVFLDRLWLAFVANDGSNRVLVCSSADGQTWTDPISVHGQLSKTAPALAAFFPPNDVEKLLVAFVANNNTNSLLVSSSTDGQTWTGDTGVFAEASQTAPSLAYRNTIDIVFIANNDTNELLYCRSSDGLTWIGPGTGLPQPRQSSKIAPSLAWSHPFDPQDPGPLGTRLWAAFVANDGSNQLLVTSRSGGDWTGATVI
jgi:hypothetical protein